MLEVRINLGAQGFGAVRELAVLHALKEGKVLLYRAVAVGGFAACLGAIGSLILCEVVLGEVADVCVALPDELDGELIAFAEVIRAVETRRPSAPRPASPDPRGWSGRIPYAPWRGLCRRSAD